jgi:integrase/recombinase XerD
VTAQRLPQPLTDAEITQVLGQPDPTTAIGLRDRAVLETGYSTGLRLTAPRPPAHHRR